jgi:hypothetical protein
VFQDEARIGQKGRTCHVWWRRGERPRCLADKRFTFAYIFAADGGADPRAPNSNGSTPMLLAVQSTGRGGSGSPGAKAQQAEILRLLDERGAT